MVYEEIREYEYLNQDKKEKPYENSEVVDKTYVSLKPAIMETIKEHIQSNASVFNASSFTKQISKPSQYYHVLGEITNCIILDSITMSLKDYTCHFLQKSRDVQNVQLNI